MLDGAASVVAMIALNAKKSRADISGTVDVCRIAGFFACIVTRGEAIVEFVFGSTIEKASKYPLKVD